MIKKAISLGYIYLGFSEHNPSSKHQEKELFGTSRKRGTTYRTIERKVY